MAATDARGRPVRRPRAGLRRAWHALRALASGLLPGVLAAPTGAATLPEDRAELMIHSYDGGGVQANGPALLVRKSLADRVSLSGSVYIDAVSNASIDVVTTASPFRETRRAFDLGADWLVRDALISAALSTSREPDYVANSAGLDVAHEVFGGMSTVSLGFTRGADEVRKAGEASWRDSATHWQYRAGLTQVLTPRWIASANLEAIADAGFLGSPYRIARVFGAAVPERVPRTRSSRALKLRSLYDWGEGDARTALRAEYRFYWDNWDIRAHTAELGASRRFTPQWLGEASLRWSAQGKALFYSDNAQADTLYVSRNRQLSTFKTTGLMAKLSFAPEGAAARWGLLFTGMFEFKQFRYADFTDWRTGTPYAHRALLFQLLASARF